MDRQDLKYRDVVGMYSTHSCRCLPNQIIHKDLCTQCSSCLEPCSDDDEERVIMDTLEKRFEAQSGELWEFHTSHGGRKGHCKFTVLPNPRLGLESWTMPLALVHKPTSLLLFRFASSKTKLVRTVTCLSALDDGCWALDCHPLAIGRVLMTSFWTV